MTKNEIPEITKLKEASSLYTRILNDPNTDFDNRKQELMEKLNNIDWETIIRFFKTNSEYEKIIRLIYEFIQQLQTGDIIALNSVDNYENCVSKKLLDVSREILDYHIQKRGTGKIKKPKKPRKPRKHTLVKKRNVKRSLQ